MKGFFRNLFYEEVTEEQQAESKQQTEQPKVQQQTQQQAQVQPIRKKERRTQEVEAQPSNKIVSLHTATTMNGAKVVLVEPRVYAEAQDIAENLKNKRATIVNLQRIDRESGIRIIDFLSGTVYALGGDIQRIGTDIFLCTPDNVEVSGEISDYMIEDL